MSEGWIIPAVGERSRRKRRSRPSIEALRRAIDYDPDTGRMTWRERDPDYFKDLMGFTEARVRTWDKLHAGKPALASRMGGYRGGTVLGFHESAHRIAFAIYHGRWPTHQIDHINGIHSDNRIENLRDVACIINTRNRPLHPANKSGVPGVWWDKGASSWVVTIGGSRKTRRYLGSFKVFEDAVAARRKAEREFGYHENHGRKAEAA